MKKKAFVSVFSIFILVLSSCRKDVSVPEITTLTVQNYSYYSASCGGLITDDGGAEVITRGLCWSTHPNPTTSDHTTINPGDRRHFMAFMHGLEPTTTYYVRAYATNAEGTGYGEIVSFSTLRGSIPELITFEPEDVFSIMAKTGGKIISDGELTITERGVCWDIEPLPTPDINKAKATGGATSFSLTVQDFLPNTAYYLRAYAINNAGIGYGNEIQFTTPPPEPDPIVLTGPAENIFQWTAEAQVAINSSNSMPVYERGICWSTSPEPTINNHVRVSMHSSDTFSIHFGNLIQNTTYYLRAYARTINQAFYGNQQTFTTMPLGISCPGQETVTDIDGNVYHTVMVGTLCWMKENLKTTRFRNGESIPMSANSLPTPAMTWYDQNIEWKDLYGGLYNRHAATSDQGICPEGWRLPSKQEVSNLRSDLLRLAHNQSISRYPTVIMSERTEPDPHPRWNQGDYPGNDLTSLSVLPGGYRADWGGFRYMGSNASFWLADQVNIMSIWNGGSTIGLFRWHSLDHLSIRCVKE
jgi:uncharacterized protein (TIGR02145 family)